MVLKGAMDTSPAVGVGRQIRLRRREHNLTLRALAVRTGLTASFLSQLERGQVSASLTSLRRIAESLNVTLLDLLDEKPAPGASRGHAAGDPVVRVAQRPKFTLPDCRVTYEILVAHLSGKLEAFIGRAQPGTGNVARRLRAPTEEFIQVIAGELKVGLTTGEYLLCPGDSIYFEGASLTELSCASADEVAWLSVITPPVF